MTTKERVERAWPILEAAKAGKEIQYRTQDGMWDSRLDLTEIFRHPERYRVAPEPREWWIVDDGSRFPYLSQIA
jgi:hypothetical protein